MSEKMKDITRHSAVLIAIEKLVNIAVHLRDDLIHVKIVMASTPMAIARKVIRLNGDKIEPPYLWGLRASLSR